MSQTCVSQLAPGPVVTEVFKLLMTVLKALQKIFRLLMSDRYLEERTGTLQDSRVA